MSHFSTINIKDDCIYSSPKWNICRGCLCEDLEFEPLSKSIEPSKTILSEMMVSCTALQVSLSDLFPQHLCCECVQQLCSAYNFKLKCERSFETLKRMQVQHFEQGTENNESIDIKSELDMYIGPIDETNIITASVETILDENIYKHNLRTSSISPPPKNDTNKKPKIVRQSKNRIKSNRLMKKHKNTFKKNITNTEEQRRITTEIRKNDDRDDQNKERNRKAYTKKHICPECGKRFDSVKRLESHRASMTHKRNQPGKIIKTCLRCKIYFEDPAEYLEHAKSHDIYLCSDCGHVCKSRSGYQAHLASHSNLQPHVCGECGKKYKSQSALHVHQRNHTGERRYSCEHCGSKFITWNSMKSHIRTHHTKEKKHVCCVCSKAFTQSGSLNIHMRQHTGEKPYPCSECDMSFRSYGDRKCHMVKHTGERKYPCTICTKRFARPYNLTQHMVTHTGERNHVCNICGRAFTQAHVLRGHMRTHPENVLIQSNAEGKISAGNELDMTNVQN